MRVAVDKNSRYWITTSAAVGNAAQIALTLVGVALIIAAAHANVVAALRAVMAAVGVISIYLDTHSIAHWAIGRAIGIAFDGYAIAGTSKPHRYPFVLRQLMSHVPFWIARVGRPCRASAGRRAAMLAAGLLSTTLATFAAAAYVRHRVPGGTGLFIAVLVWLGVSTVTGVALPEGEYRRAIAAAFARS